uniref:CCDC113/CCDC96 coiled-coil domain-containing protein n=2 Tax=Echeneis naucrates TaxID=173247 RepID=A0A665TW43_ECHNA
MSHEESVVFEIDSNDYNNGDDDDDDGGGAGAPRLYLKTPDGERTSRPTQDEEEEVVGAELTAASAGNITCKECTLVLRELCEQSSKTSQHGRLLQASLAEYLRKKPGDDAQLEEEMQRLLHKYEKCMNTLTELKQQIAADSEAAQQQEDELRLLSQDSVEKVEDEWQELLALKQHTAVMALTQRLGKQAAQAKVESALVAEQLRQDELVKLRLQHIKLKIKIEGLEAELREREEDRRDPLQLQFQQLQAMRLEQRKLFEKQSEESSKLQTKIVSGLELLSNIKEKLFWDQMEVQCKREQLAEVEATVARKRDLLTRTKQAWNRLQKDNLRLKECRGLLGNRVLLQDFEKTVDASDHLEEEMENLKSWKAEITLKFLH